MIFAITGSFLGLMSDRGRGSIADYVGNVVYNIVALGLMAMVSSKGDCCATSSSIVYRSICQGVCMLPKGYLTEDRITPLLGTVRVVGGVCVLR